MYYIGVAFPPIPLRAGESLFVPADAPGFALAGNGELLLTTV